MRSRVVSVLAPAVVLLGLTIPVDAAADDGDGPDFEMGLTLDLAGIGGLDPQTLALGIGNSASMELLVRPHPVISLALGGQMFAMYGDGAVAWFGTREGLRFHWSALIDGFEPDAYIEVVHIFGLSGTVARHGVDIGLGMGFWLFQAMSAGPTIHLIFTDDPDGTPVWALTVGLTITGWPGRPSYDAPAAYVSRAHRPRYVAPSNLEMARQRVRGSQTLPLLPHVELFGLHALDDGHRDSIGFGGGATASVEFPFAPWIGVQAGVTGLAVSAASGNPAAWAGTQLGLRFHWTPLAGIEGDGWLDAHWVYGVSGGITTHGADVGVGYSFDALSFLRVGPMVRGTLLTDPGDEPAILLQIGVAFTIRAPERGPGNLDGDFTLDRDDHCQDTEEGGVVDPLNPGCPLLDRDSDGIPDDRDMCDAEPEGDDPDPDRLGCPLPDHDGDGVPDAHDFCPEEVGVPNESDPLRDGCPIGAFDATRRIEEEPEPEELPSEVIEETGEDD
ncbi:MAG: hypothetical protein AB7S26_32935 [Sandaracinaceae bacterium]